ncbi:AIPR family protein [Micromonospora sp. NPDC003944]
MSQPNVEETMEQVLAQRTDLDRYRSNKRLMFAAELMLGPEDVHDLARSSLTDQPGDRSCDFVHVDRAQGLIVVAQGYEATSTTRLTVEQRKVRDLNQAVNRVFTAETIGLPAPLIAAIQNVRAALDDGVIRRIEIWFVHNRDQQADLEEVLKDAQDIARNAVQVRNPQEAEEVEVVAHQISRKVLADWFRSLQTPILVTEPIRVPVENWLVENTPSRDRPVWTGYLATVSMEWLKGQFWAHENNLFSGNVRGYLGKVSSAFNINNGIRETLRTEPGNFWIYNNGITALVNKVYPDGGELVVEGLSIVNGAQTTGALHRASQLGALDEARVLIRFIQCADPAIIQKVIKYTNRQNATVPADFRSNDHVQRRLVKEFENLGVVGYTGGRRSTETDGIRRTPSDGLSATYVAQAVASFHGDPGTAREPGTIWTVRDTYRRYFNGRTTAAHLLLCGGLARAGDRRREVLKGEPRKLAAQQEFFARQNSTWLLVAALAASLPVILPRCPDDKLRIRLTGGGLDQASNIWLPFVEAVGPRLEVCLGGLLDDPRALRQSDTVREKLVYFREQVTPDIESQDDALAAFRDAVRVVGP